MALENYPVFSFEPNWKSPFDESLMWQTDIMTSTTGAEQRRAMRIFPRREFEFEVVTQGEGRGLLDNLLVTYGAQRWYLPLWHDASVSTYHLAAGSTFIPCPAALSSLLKANEPVLITNGDPYIFEIRELSHTDEHGINLKTGLSKAWPAGTRVYPVVTARLTDQPTLKALSGSLATTDVRFMDFSDSTAPSSNTRHPDPLETFSNKPLMTIEPNWTQMLSHTFERMVEELDNGSARPYFRDMAQRAFPLVEMGWTLDGRAERLAFYDILYGLRGRAHEIFMPTFMEDLQLVSDVSNGSSTIEVKMCGYNRSGGPRPGRQHILIQGDDFLVKRRIVAASEGGGIESLLLDMPVGRDIPMRRVKRVSFMARMRLNSDTVTISHDTDTMGISRCSAKFRGITSIRVEN